MDNEADPNAQAEGSLMSQIVRMGLSSVATNVAFSALADGVVATQMPDGGQPTSGPLDLNGEIIRGPVEGGGFIERPISGALADHAMSQSIELTYADGGTIMQGQGAGSLTVNGLPINVADYLPGADYVQAVGGGLDASDGLSMMAQMVTRPGTGRVQAFEATSPELRGPDGLPFRLNPDAAGQTVENDFAKAAIEHGKPYAREEELDAGKAELEHAERHRRSELEREHRLDMAEALRTTDAGQVTTSVGAGEGAVSITTSFEARDSDVDKEKRLGDEHVREALQSPSRETNLHNETIRMQSQIEEDQGRGLSYSATIWVRGQRLSG